MSDRDPTFASESGAHAVVLQLRVHVDPAVAEVLRAYEAAREVLIATGCAQQITLEDFVASRKTLSEVLSRPRPADPVP